MNTTSGKYSSLAFIWIAALQDILHKLLFVLLSIKERNGNFKKANTYLV